MSRIILIETSTALCSAALVEDGTVTAQRVSDTPRSQAALTAPFVDEVLKERSLRVSDCDAVAVSAGPGSYTGLRVGVSTAKGLCFSCALPLISVCTLDILVRQAIAAGLPEGCRAVIPMIDARRMEVYTAVYSPQGERLTDIEAKVIDGDSFAGLEGPVLFIGDGALKCEGTINVPGSVFVSAEPLAAAMAVPATEAFERRDFVDTAYFEPFYLKQFVTTVSKKKLF